jgi:hypothetical protein
MSENLPPATVKFHLIKGNFFRVIHADGAIGGITPSGEIFLSLFSERGAIPQLIEQAINADGSLGEEIKKSGKDGIVREIEVGVVLSAKAAKGIAEWLAKQAQILEASEPQQGLVSNTDVGSVEELP